MHQTIYYNHLYSGMYIHRMRFFLFIPFSNLIDDCALKFCNSSIFCHHLNSKGSNEIFLFIPFSNLLDCGSSFLLYQSFKDLEFFKRFAFLWQKNWPHISSVIIIINKEKYVPFSQWSRRGNWSKKISMYETKYVSSSIQTFRTDWRGEFISKEFQDFYRKYGISRHLTTPYSPQQNGVIERRTRLSLIC